MQHIVTRNSSINVSDQAHEKTNCLVKLELNNIPLSRYLYIHVHVDIEPSCNAEMSDKYICGHSVLNQYIYEYIAQALRTGASGL